MSVRGGGTRAVPLVLCVLLLAGCTGEAPRPASDPPSVPADGPSTAAPPGAGGSAPAPPVDPTPADPEDVRVDVAVRAVEELAGRIGPRLATGPGYRRAARWVTAELKGLGYDVRSQNFQVPAGSSWGVPVAASSSANVIATPAGFDSHAPHLVLGAHLDTVAGSPGAEDNASGVGALLASATALRGRSTRLPVVLVAFGAEEPRGPSDDEHHYGSRHYVAALEADERAAVRGMLSLDRVGVGNAIPVCSAGDRPDRHQRRVLRAAQRAGVESFGCTGNRSSDHWSFVRAGLPGVRLGSTPYAAYHSPGDLPEVVQRAQLRRAARTAVAWVSGP